MIRGPDPPARSAGPGRGGRVRSCARNCATTAPADTGFERCNVCHLCADCCAGHTDDEREFATLIERGSLGSPGARAIRARSAPIIAQRALEQHLRKETQ
jgi:hypothetical protein